MTHGRPLAVTALAVASCLGVVVACDDDGTTATTAATAGDVLPPVIADLGAIEGTTVEVRVGGTIDLTGDDETFTGWTAAIADPAIAEFTPGREDGSASFNPGITGLAPGSTEVTLTNATTDTSVTFTVEVIP